MKRRLQKIRTFTGCMGAWRASVFALMFMLLAVTVASAGTNDQIYAIGAGTHNIYTVNTTTGAVTTIFTNYNAATSAALAQRPSDGILFFTLNATNGGVFTWNPATPATAPVQIGSVGNAIGALPRLAFSSSGVLYAMDSATQNLYTINQATGVATVVATFTGLTTGVGGDIAFAPDGTLYIGAGRNIYRASVGGGAVTNLGAITGMTAGVNFSGIAFDLNGTLFGCDDNSPSTLYSINISTLVATA